MKKWLMLGASLAAAAWFSARYLTADPREVFFLEKLERFRAEALLDAVQECNLEEVKKLSRDSDLRADYNYGERGSLISNAATAPIRRDEGNFNCAVPIIEFLVSSGADVNYVSFYEGGATPLIRAIYVRNCGAAKALLKAGADPAIQCEHTLGGRPSCGEMVGKNAIEVYQQLTKPKLQSEPNYQFPLEQRCWDEVELFLKPYEKKVP